MSSVLVRYSRPLVAAAFMFATGGAWAQHWSPPTSLDVNGDWTFPQIGPQVVMDGSGNALAAWQHANSPIYVSSHTAGGTWSVPQALNLSGSLYGLQLGGGGTATVVGASAGIFAADRAADGSWSAPVTLATPIYWGERALGVPLVILVGNANGDQAVVWEQSDGGGSPETIMAARRPAGGTWGAPEIVFSQGSGLYIPLAGAAMGATGDLLVTWETYQIVCTGRNCSHENFTVYAAREQAGTSGWTASGALSAPISNTYGYYVKPLIDAAGQGALVFDAVNDEVTIQAVRQTASTLKWGTAVTVLGDTAGMTLFGAISGGNALGSVAALSQSATGQQLTEVDGNLAKNTWGTPVNLAAADPVAPAAWTALGGDAKGGRVALWYDLDGTVRIAERKSASGAFGAAVTLLPGACAGASSGCATPEPSAVAMNAAGQAVAVFQQPVFVGSAWSLYATTTN